jgi:hypothetical protein
MCHMPKGTRESMMHDACGCGCLCPASLTVEDEIEMLESHKNTLQEQIEFLTQKITVLRSVNAK